MRDQRCAWILYVCPIKIWHVDVFPEACIVNVGFVIVFEVIIKITRQLAINTLMHIQCLAILIDA